MQSISRKEVADLVGLEIMAELHQIRKKNFLKENTREVMTRPARSA